jgi:archaeosine-15-forming tRNA-guanine transglycosylase
MTPELSLRVAENESGFLREDEEEKKKEEEEEEEEEVRCDHCKKPVWNNLPGFCCKDCKRFGQALQEEQYCVDAGKLVVSHLCVQAIATLRAGDEAQAVQDAQRCVDAGKLVVSRLCSQAIDMLKAGDEAQVVQDEQRCVDAARLVVMRLCSQAVAILRADDEAQSAQDEQRCAWKPQSENAQIADPPSQVAPMDSTQVSLKRVASSNSHIEWKDEGAEEARYSLGIGCCSLGDQDLIVEHAQIAEPPSQVAPMDSAIPVPQCVASSHAVIELDESTNKAGDRRWIGCCFVGPERASLCQPFLGYKYRY